MWTEQTGAYNYIYAALNAAEVEGRYCLLKKSKLGTSLEVHPEDGFSCEKPVKSEKTAQRKAARKKGCSRGQKVLKYKIFKSSSSIKFLRYI